MNGHRAGGWASVWLMAVVLGGLPGPAQAQDGGGQVGTEELFRDAIFLLRTGVPGQANNFMEALLARNPDPRELLRLSDAEGDAEEILVTVIDRVRQAEVRDNAAKLLDLIKKGKYAQRNDPGYIADRIGSLSELGRPRDRAAADLIESGEFAVPALVDYLRNTQAEPLHPAIVDVLNSMGRHSVAPLCQALAVRDAVIRQQLCSVLAEIGYPQALPFLKRLVETDSDPAVQRAAVSAIQRIAGDRVSLDTPASRLFFELAEQFYYDRGSLQADPQFEVANVWYWDAAGQKLRRVEVPRPIYNDVMAMRMAEISLSIEPRSDAALALWLAANFAREADLGEGTDKTRPEGFEPAAYFARFAGPRLAYQVLERGIRDNNTAVALGAIRALRDTAGEPVGKDPASTPLIAALKSTNRVIRIEAGLAVGLSLPASGFEGSSLVVPVLAESLLLTANPSAVVVVPDEAARNALAAALRNENFNVVATADIVSALNQARSELPGVDVFFLSTEMGGGGGQSVQQALDMIADDFMVSGAVTVLLAGADQSIMARSLASASPSRVSVDFSTSNSADAIAAYRAGMEKAGKTAIDPRDAENYALASADVLGMLALTRNAALDVSIAQNALIAGLARDDFEDLQIRIGRVLAQIRSVDAQRALASKANDNRARASTRIALYTSLADSAKLQGNKLTEEQVAALSETVDSGDPDVKVAASMAIGALNLTADRSAMPVLRHARP